MGSKFILECLGIDWKVTKLPRIIEIMYSKGYKRKGVLKEKEKVKQEIITVLQNVKTGIKPPSDQMSTIFANIEKCDHHDLCRIDQIITRMHNEECTDYQWGSIVLDCKWKAL